MTIVLNGTTGITNDGGYTGDGVVFADTTPANTLVTTTGGNVGIGTSSPAQKLHIAKNGTLGIRLENQATNYWDIENNSNLLFSRGGTEYARIDSSGNLLVGTTSAGGEIGRLTVKQDADADSGGLRLIAPNSTNAWAIRTGSDSSLYFGYNGTSKGVINQSSGNYSALSDVRLKENVQESVKGLSEILALRSVSYTFIDDEAKTEQLGFIAQEVEPVIPQVVSTPTSSNKYYGLNYSGVVPVLVKAIQEQQAIITALTARVEALEGTQP
jgi:hypothetical protein